MGSEINVPCHLTPEICAIGMQIKWFKETDCVCIYKNRHVIEGRSYRDRVSLDTHVLERGNVSLHVNIFSVSDVGDYYCQVISGGRTQQITVGVSIKPEVQPVSQSPRFQGRSIHLKLFEIDKVWTKQETDIMNKSALMAGHYNGTAAPPRGHSGLMQHLTCEARSSLVVSVYLFVCNCERQ
ncbi:butyrophilin-like protein 1 isoform X3 [Carassius carassius]|uniref:butyrophilin-like protein 1 isoform X3 n=1 Tax=Carassius carassius TaxID=217509 RepID=UPI0028694575|nr:butyrophilin-like protein 1 isoform X3 [Carassius carassius]